MDVFTREASWNLCKNAETGRATQHAAQELTGGRRELCGHDRPGQQVRHTDRSRRSRAPDEVYFQRRDPCRYVQGALVHHRLEAVVGRHRGQRGVVGQGDGLARCGCKGCCFFGQAPQEVLNLSGLLQQRPKMAFWVSFTTFSATTLLAALELHEACHEGAAGEAVGSAQPPAWRAAGT